MALTLIPHVYQKTSGINQFKLVRTVPYVRLGNGNVHFFVQEGNVYDEAGRAMKTVPPWVVEEIEKMTPEARAEVGLLDKADSAKKVN